MGEPIKGGILLEVNTHDGWFDVCITQDIDTDRYVDTFVASLEENQIAYSFEGKEEISLPTQKVF